MSYMTDGRPTYSRRERAALAAASAAAQEAENRRVAGLSFDEYLAEVAADYGRTHTSNVAAGEDLDWYRERHARLVAQYR